MNFFLYFFKFLRLGQFELKLINNDNVKKRPFFLLEGQGRMSLSERFKRLPEEQQLRSEESDRQARDASELLRRLRVTRQEAEKLAKEEIERTRRTQREELEIHPEIVELKKRLRIAEREKDLWERKKKDQERFYNVELESLKREEAAQLNRFNSAQEEELKSIREYENMQRERVPIFSFPTHFFYRVNNKLR